MLQRDQEILVQLLFLAPRLVLQAVPLGDGIVLFRVGGRDLLAVDAALEHLDRARIFR